MTVSVIPDEIQTQVYNSLEYPSMENTDDGSVLVPEGLSRFLPGIVKSKATQLKSVERRTAFIMSCCHLCVQAQITNFTDSSLNRSLRPSEIWISRIDRHAEQPLRTITRKCNGYSYQATATNASSVRPSSNQDGFSRVLFDNTDFNVAIISRCETCQIFGQFAGEQFLPKHYCAHTLQFRHSTNIVTHATTVPSLLSS